MTNAALLCDDKIRVHCVDLNNVYCPGDIPVGLTRKMLATKYMSS